MIILENLNNFSWFDTIFIDFFNFSKKLIIKTHVMAKLDCDANGKQATLN